MRIKTIKIIGNLLISISLYSLGYVSFMAWWSPNAIMALVGEQLNNADAISSIRGVYGAAGLFLIIIMSYVWSKSLLNALRFLSLFWSLYAIARLVTLLYDGPLGNFATLWLSIEMTFAIFSGSIAFIYQYYYQKGSNIHPPIKLVE